MNEGDVLHAKVRYIGTLNLNVSDLDGETLITLLMNAIDFGITLGKEGVDAAMEAVEEREEDLKRDGE